MEKRSKPGSVPAEREERGRIEATLAGEGQECRAVVTDITEHKRADEALLRTSEERYRSLFENMREGVAYCRMLYENKEPRDFLYLAVNSAFESLTGLKGAAGRKVSEVIPGIQASNRELFEVFGRVALSGKPERLETYVDPLGIWLSISVYSPGKEYFVSVFDIITERKRMEEALRESAERYRTVADFTQDWAYWRTADGRLLYVSPSCERITGYRAEEFMENPGLLDTIVHSDDRPLYERHKSVALQGGDEPGLHEVDFRIIHRDGSVRWIGHTCQAIRRSDATSLGVRGSNHDITERKRAEQERAHLEEQLRQAQKLESAGRLAGGVAHDFNNLLTVINGYSDLMMEQLSEGDPLRNSLAEIRKAGERAAGLTQQLLAFSRKQVIQPKPLNLNHMVAETRDMLQRLVGEDVELVTTPAPSLGQVMADQGQIHQVLMNLAVNARDAMPTGGTLTIETANAELDQNYAAAHPGVAPGDYVLLSVSDTGIGIDEEIREHIFDPFFTTKGVGKGTGLGLSTVYGIVRQCGGWIWVYSEPGRGATFKIYMPRMGAPIEAGEAAAPAPGALRGSETVLVVEDQEDVRRLAVKILRSYGYRVLEAAQGGEALLVAERHAGPIHLMLTDVVMPRMTGNELAGRLKPLRPQMRVLYMSGYTENAIAHRGVLDPAVDFVAKPFSPHALALKVREVLGPPRPAGTILVVDDEEGIRNLFQ